MNPRSPISQGKTGPESSPLTCFVLLCRPARIRVLKFKSTAFIYTNGDQSEAVLAGETPFIIATEEIKFLVIKIIINVQHLCNKNFKHSKWAQKIEKQTNTHKPCS